MLVPAAGLFGPRNGSDRFLPLLWLVDRARFVSWNAQALFHSSPQRCRKKLAFAQKLLNPWTVLALQETHGDPAMLSRFGRRFAISHEVLSSFCPRPLGADSRLAGGLIALVPRCPSS